MAHISQVERNRLTYAFLALDKSKIYPDGVTYWDEQEEIHKNAHAAGQDVHSGPALVPWHRELCNRLERATAILVVICIIAGWSERLLPSLIKQLEGTLVRNVEEVEFVEADGGAEGGRDEPGKPKRMLRSFLLRRKE